MLCRNFQLIPINFEFFMIFNIAKKSGPSPCTIVHGLWPNFAKNEKERILHFNNFS